MTDSFWQQIIMCITRNLENIFTLMVMYSRPPSCCCQDHILPLDCVLKVTEGIWSTGERRRGRRPCSDAHVAPVLQQMVSWFVECVGNSSSGRWDNWVTASVWLSHATVHPATALPSSQPPPGHPPSAESKSAASPLNLNTPLHFLLYSVAAQHILD